MGTAMADDYPQNVYVLPDVFLLVCYFLLQYCWCCHVLLISQSMWLWTCGFISVSGMFVNAGHTLGHFSWETLAGCWFGFIVRMWILWCQSTIVMRANVKDYWQWNKLTVEEGVNRFWLSSQHVISYYRDKSFQAVDCTRTDIRLLGYTFSLNVL